MDFKFLFDLSNELLVRGRNLIPIYLLIPDFDKALFIFSGIEFVFLVIPFSSLIMAVATLVIAGLKNRLAKANHPLVRHSGYFHDVRTNYFL